MINPKDLQEIIEKRFNGDAGRLAVMYAHSNQSGLRSLSYRRKYKDDADRMVVVLSDELSVEEQIKAISEEIALADGDEYDKNSNHKSGVGYWLRQVEELMLHLSVPLTVQGVIIPERKTEEGLLIKSTSIVWNAVIEQLSRDWARAYEIPPNVWEEIIAGAFSKAGFDEVVLTPRSGDYGRDVVATRKGRGSIKIIGSVKAYKPGHLVKHDDVRALLGVMSGEQNASKGILTTTSDFAPKIKTDPFIKPFLPTRLELVNGAELQEWLVALAKI